MNDTLDATQKTEIALAYWNRRITPAAGTYTITSAMLAEALRDWYARGTASTKPLPAPRSFGARPEKTAGSAGVSSEDPTESGERP